MLKVDLQLSARVITLSSNEILLLQTAALTQRRFRLTGAANSAQSGVLS
jgi:hypothetical protein